MKLLKPLITLVCIMALASCGNHTQQFSYKLIPVSADGKWGYIDKTGKYIVNSQFHFADLFTEGLALVQAQDGKFGYVDEHGTYVIQPGYSSATHFSEGYAFVVTDDGTPVCIDKQGKTKFSTDKALSASVFCDGLSGVCIKNKYGFIDKEGKMVISAQFDEVNSFSEGMAAVANNTEKGEKKWGYINKEGKMIIAEQFDDAGDFSEGKAGVKSGGKYGFIDEKGSFSINPQFEFVAKFSDGMAGVIQDNRWGFVDKSGKLSISPQFIDAGQFRNGLAPVAQGKDNWGYIDKAGKYSINPQFAAASTFYGDFAFVMLGGKLGLIDKQGKYLVNPQFDNSFAVYSPNFGSFLDADMSRTAVSEDFRVHDIAANFLLSYYRLNYDAAKEYGTAETNKTLDMMEQLSGKFFPDSMKQAAKKITVEIKDVKRQGDKATVTYNTSSGLAENSIHLVKVDGDWKVQWTKQDQIGASDSNAIVPAPQVAPTRPSNGR